MGIISGKMCCNSIECQDYPYSYSEISEKDCFKIDTRNSPKKNTCYNSKSYCSIYDIKPNDKKYIKNKKSSPAITPVSGPVKKILEIPPINLNN